MRPRASSIRRKLLLVMALTTLTALLVAIAAMAFYDLRSHDDAVRHDIETQTELLGSASAAALIFNDPEAAAENLRVLRHRGRIAAAAIYDAGGELFATYTRSGEPLTFPDRPGPAGTLVEDRRVLSFMHVIEDGDFLGTAYISADHGMRQRMIDYLVIAIAVLLGGLAAAALMALRLQSLITRPILSVAEVAREVVTRGDFSLRAPKTTADEVGALSDAFNSMLEEIELRRAEIIRLNEGLELRIKQRTAQLERSNQDLESFSYSVSHDLRSPLRAIAGFGDALREELPDLSPEGERLFERIRAATRRMSQRIDGLLNLAQLSRSELKPQRVDLGRLVREIHADLAGGDPGRAVEVDVAPDLVGDGDPKLLRALLENLLENAWKFTADTADARIEVGALGNDGQTVYFVKDNGAGFDMAFADKLYTAFSRLHANDEYPGSGIGLATVQRIVHRHGGRIWAEAAPGAGATFFFTLGGRA